MAIQSPHVRWFADLRNTDVPEVGGKNASLGELYSALAHEGIACLYRLRFLGHRIEPYAATAAV